MGLSAEKSRPFGPKQNLSQFDPEQFRIGLQGECKLPCFIVISHRNSVKTDHNPKKNRLRRSDISKSWYSIIFISILLSVNEIGSFMLLLAIGDSRHRSLYAYSVWQTALKRTSICLTGGYCSGPWNRFGRELLSQAVFFLSRVAGAF